MVARNDTLRLLDTIIWSPSGPPTLGVLSIRCILAKETVSRRCLRSSSTGLGRCANGIANAARIGGTKPLGHAGEPAGGHVRLATGRAAPGKQRPRSLPAWLRTLARAQGLSCLHILSQNHELACYGPQLALSQVHPILATLLRSVFNCYLSLCYTDSPLLLLDWISG